MKKLILIILLALNLNVFAEENNLSILEQKFDKCTEDLTTNYNDCPDSWSMKCYPKLMNAHHNVQNCYKEVAVELFINFYDLPKEEAEKRFNAFSNAIYDQYQFVFWNTNYCKKNNCGIGLYLYANYATSEELQYYVNKIIRSIKARNQ